MIPLQRQCATALALVVLSLGPGCERSEAPASGKSAKPTATVERVLRRGNGGDPSSLDPQKSSDHYAQEVQRDLFEGLTSEAADGKVVPGVAESWALSDDGRTYRFRLRQSARWSDGSPVVADQFVAAFRTAVDPMTASPAADLLRPIVNAERIIEGGAPPDQLGVRALGPRELEINLVRPVPYFPSLLTHPVFFPRHPSFSSTRASRGSLVSNGAFRLEKWLPNDHISLVRNPQYWNAGTVRLDRVLFYPIASESDEYMRYRAGALDFTASVPPNQIAQVRRDRPAELRMAPYLGTSFLGFNLRRTPFAGNSDLRLALSMAIDRQALGDLVLKGTQVPALGLVPPGTASYASQRYDWASRPEAERLKRARSLFLRATAGSVEPLRIRLIYGSSEVVRHTLVAIAAMWKEAFGISVEIVSEEFRVFLDTQHDPDRWEIVRMSWVADFDDASAFLEIFRTGNPSNVFGYSNRRFDGLLDAAQHTSSTRERAALLEEAERILLADSAFLPIFHVQSRHLVSPRVIGFQSNPLNRTYSRHLQLQN